MRRSWIALLLLALFPGAGAAIAQTVFFDDFDGDALLPHWNQPPPSFWEHDVSNGMLNVTGLFNPSSPKSPSNFASINAAFATQADFQADVWMGWEAGQGPHRLEFDILAGPGQGSIIASMGYMKEGLNPVIFAGASNQAVFMSAPAPGIQHFTISRTGTEIDFYLNGDPVASFSGTSGFRAAGLRFFFLGPYPGELGAFHIDRIQVVPAPGTLLVFSAAFAFGSTRRRKR